MELYHHSPKENHDSIKVNGLQVKHDRTEMNGIFLIDRPSDSENSDIWAVDCDGLELEPDTMWSGEGKSYICFSDIPSERLADIEQVDEELKHLIGFWIEKRQQVAYMLNVDLLECVNSQIFGIKKKVNKRGEVRVQVRTLGQMK